MILPLMTTAGTYQFRVRAIPKDTEETAYITSSDWVYSDELDIDADEVCTLSGGAVGGPDKADALTPSQLDGLRMMRLVVQEHRRHLSHRYMEEH